MAGDLTVTGTVTAQEFHAEFVSSSIIYESGSTKFGDTMDDIHWFTGSMLITGSSHHIFGDVGIGTTNPLSLLHIEGQNNLDVNDYAHLYIKGTGTYPGIMAGIVLDASGSQSHLRFSNNGSPKFQFRYNDGNMKDDKLKVYS